MPARSQPTSVPAPRPRDVPRTAELIARRRAVPPPPPPGRAGALVERFLLPPFSVLDARQGYWQTRKRMWLDLGIQSELGRGTGIVPNGSIRDASGDGCYQRGYHRANAGMQDDAELRIDNYRGRGKGTNATVTGRAFPACRIQPDKGAGEKYARGDGRGHPINDCTPGGRGKNSAWTGTERKYARTYGSGKPGDLAAGFRDRAENRLTWVAGDRPEEELDEVSRKILAAQPQSGTSIFDPVLCEIAYRWFSPARGRVLDPFAGGSVRGIVAAKLGRGYAGVDLRPEQAEANRVQAAAICPDAPDLTWAVGDSLFIDSLLPGEYDLIFSCPPYADLERYSDDPRDLSTMPYDRFLEAYREIIGRAAGMLRPDRFAVWVVGDVRDEAGCYRNFPGDTVEAFRAAGMELYNEAVLVTAVGSLPIRVGKQFAGYRKLGKTHQNVLVFVKGDPGRAARACGEVDVDDLEMPEAVPGAVAVCAQDCAGLEAEGLVDGDGADVVVIPLDRTEASLYADILRGEARAADRPAPRTWVAGPDGWKRVDDGVELTYLVGDDVYLNRDVFPGARGPVDTPPPPKRLR